jgi:hypothetical protein
MTLPFDQITKTGVLLPLFRETCEKGYEAGENPTTIVETFFQKYQARRTKKVRLSFYLGSFNTLNARSYFLMRLKMLPFLSLTIWMVLERCVV